MSIQSDRSIDDAQIIPLIKEISGRRIEQRRRRDRISQSQLALAVGRSERWVREIESGIPSSALEDHVRCAHWLGMSTAHIFIPFLFVEHKMAIPLELLMIDDLWDVTQACIAVISPHQTTAQTRQALQHASPHRHRPG